MNKFPATVKKKVKLLNYFRNYMKENLRKAGANMEVNFGRMWHVVSDVPSDGQILFLTVTDCR